MRAALTKAARFFFNSLLPLKRYGAKKAAPKMERPN